jgi:hypothetical protein
VLSGIMQFAVKKRLPTIVDWTGSPAALVEPYPLLCYGRDSHNAWRNLLERCRPFAGY